MAKTGHKVLAVLDQVSRNMQDCIACRRPDDMVCGPATPSEKPLKFDLDRIPEKS